MTDGPAPDPKFVQPKGFIERLAKLVKAHPKGKPLDPATGQLLPDPTPIAPPIGYFQEESMFDRMRRVVRAELSAAAAERGGETFEEANDFDIEDDIPEPFSPYEEYMLFKGEPTPDEDDKVEARAAAPAPSKDAPAAAGGGRGGLSQQRAPRSTPPGKITPPRPSNRVCGPLHGGRIAFVNQIRPQCTLSMCTVLGDTKWPTLDVDNSAIPMTPTLNR